MVKIAAIEYLNTIPFIYGLQHHSISKEVELISCVPSKGAEMLLNNEVDLGIIPVAALLNNSNNYKIVSNYCIGATSTVASVLLVSNKPLEEIDTIYLDTDSNTSVLLCRVLASKFWKIEPKYINYTFSLDTLDKANSYILIGDKALKYANDFKYSYDLAAEWIKFRDKPFVFACWIANKTLDEAFLERLNDAFAFGVSNIKKSVEENYRKYPFTKEYQYNYLINNISYIFDNSKKEGLKDFCSLAIAEKKEFGSF